MSPNRNPRSSSLPMSSTRLYLQRNGAIAPPNTPDQAPPVYSGPPPLIRPQPYRARNFVDETSHHGMAIGSSSSSTTPSPMVSNITLAGRGVPGDPIIISDDVSEGAEYLMNMRTNVPHAIRSQNEGSQQGEVQTSQPVPVLCYVLLGSRDVCRRFFEMFIQTPEYRRLGVVVKKTSQQHYRQATWYTVQVILNGPNDRIKDRVEKRLLEMGLTKVGSSLAFKNYFFQKIMMVVPSAEMEEFGF